MKKSIFLIAFLFVNVYFLSGQSNSAQDTISNKKKEHKFLYGISIKTFNLPKVTGTGIFDNQRKQSYGFNAGVMYRLNNKLSINMNLGILKFHFHFHYSYYFKYNPGTGISGAMIYDIKNTCLNLSAYMNYDIIKFREFILYTQFGSNLLAGTRTNENYYKQINYIIPPSPERAGSISNYSLAFGLGAKYYIKKNLIFLNCTLIREKK